MKISASKKVTAVDLVYFFQQLATLIEAGVALAQSLSLLAQIQEKKFFCHLITTLRGDLENGKTFNQALQRFPQHIDALTCNMIRLGEQTGTLELMLKRTAVALEKKLLLQGRLKQALIYPALLSCAALTTTFILLFFIVPHFASLFENFPHQLPPLTRAIISLSQLLRHLSLGTLIISLFFLVLIPKITLSKVHWQYLLLKLPYLGTLLKKLWLLNFSRNLATTLSASIPLSEALILISSLPSHKTLRESIQNLQAGVHSGKRFYLSLARNAVFPPLLVQMAKTGEESGTLELMLQKFADFYEIDLQRSVNMLSQLLEPLIISILGVLIGGIVIAMYLPLFQLGTAM